MASGFTFRSAPTFRDLQGRFARAEKELLEARRAAMRALGRRFAGLAQAEAPGGAGHTVANQVGFQTFVEGGAVGFLARLGQIARWHVSGTGLYGPRRRVIRPTHAQALHFFIGGREFFRAREPALQVPERRRGAECKTRGHQLLSQSVNALPNDLT